MALDDADKKTIGEMIAAGLAKAGEQVGALAGSMKTLTDNLGKTISDAIDAKVKPLAETVAKIGVPKDDKKKEGEPEPAADLDARIAAALDKSLKPIAEFVGAKKTEEERAAGREAAKVLVTRTLTEKKLGGLVKNAGVMERLIAGAPKDADAVMALVEAERAYAASLGLKAETFGADPAAEGAKGANGKATNEEEKKAATAEAIDRAAKASASIL